VILVVDASVAAKWFLQFRKEETHVQHALGILGGIAAERIQLVQPPHFLAEMGAVLAREKPDGAAADLTDLMAIDFATVSTPDIHQTACELAIRLGHHMFDTLYHAVALHTPGAVLVTADHRYYAKARILGQIVALEEFTP
jgi:predicted nucleic acid-binding protein